MLREHQRPLVFRPEAAEPKSGPELTLMHELELRRKPELTTPALGARTAFVSVARSSGETANCTPMRRRPRPQLQLSRTLAVRASSPFHVWPAYSYRSPVTVPGRDTQ